MQTNTPTTSHFTPSIMRGQDGTMHRRIGAAYRACGLTPPVPRTVHVEAAIAGLPTVLDVAQDLAAESLDVDEKDAQKWVTAALDRITRARAAEDLRAALKRHQTRAVKDRSRDLLDAALTDLAPAFADTADQLTKAAKKLPGEPFDMGQIVATDTTRAAREAGQALEVMARIADIFDSRNGNGIGRDTGALLPVVHVPTVTVEEVNALTRQPLDPHDPDNAAREAIRAFERDAGTRGADVTLVAVARGDYGEHIRLELGDPDTNRERRHALTAALSRHAGESWGRKSARAFTS